MDLAARANASSHRPHLWRVQLHRLAVCTRLTAVLQYSSSLRALLAALAIPPLHRCYTNRIFFVCNEVQRGLDTVSHRASKANIVFMVGVAEALFCKCTVRSTPSKRSKNRCTHEYCSCLLRAAVSKRSRNARMSRPFNKLAESENTQWVTRTTCTALEVSDLWPFYSLLYFIIRLPVLSFVMPCFTTFWSLLISPRLYFIKGTVGKRHVCSVTFRFIYFFSMGSRFLL